MARLIDLDTPRGKFTDVAAEGRGWCVVCHDEATGDLVLHQLHPDGVARVPEVRIPIGGGNAFPRLYVWSGATFLGYRRGFDLEGLLHNLTTGLVTPLGPVYGNDPIAFGSWFVAYQASADYRIERRVVHAPAGIAHLDHVGRGTGLSGVTAEGGIVLVDDVRTSVRGLVNPRRAGSCVVGENASGIDRDIARLDDGREANLWPGLASNTPRIAFDGHTYAVATWGLKNGIGGARLALLTDGDFTVPLPEEPPANPFELAPEGTLVEDSLDAFFGSHPSLKPGSTRESGVVCLHKNVNEAEWRGYDRAWIYHLFDASRRVGDPGWFLVPLDTCRWAPRRFHSGDSFTVEGWRVEADTQRMVPWRHTNTLFALKHGGVMLQFDPRFPGDRGMGKRYERFFNAPGKIGWQEWYTPAGGGPDVLHRTVWADVVPSAPQPYLECPRPTITDPPHDPPTDPAMPELVDIPRDILLGAFLRFRDEVLLERDRVPPDTMSAGALAIYFIPHYTKTVNNLFLKYGPPQGSSEAVNRTWSDWSVQGLIAAATVYDREQKGTGGGGGDTIEPGPGLHGALRTEGRIFVDDGGPRFPAWSGCLLGLADGLEPRRLLDQLAAIGFGGVRVFGGHLDGRNQTAASARARFPWFKTECHLRGLRVELTACTDTQAGNYNIGEHVIACAQMQPDALELWNEVGHPTQLGITRDQLLELLQRAREHYQGPIALGAADVDELPWNEQAQRAEDYPTAGGTYITIHLRRGQRPFYVNACRIKEQHDVSERHGVPVINNEPERAEDLDNPVAFAYLMGVLGRGFGGGTVFHSSQARDAQVLTGIQLAAATAFVRGHRMLRDSRGLMTFKNGRWPDSPVGNAAYVEGEGVRPGKTVWRTPSFIKDREGVVVCTGPDAGRHDIQWANGWSPSGVADTLDGVTVLAIHRG